MSIKRLYKKVNINNKIYYLCLDMDTIIAFKENTGLNFLETIEKLKVENDEVLYMKLISYMIRKRIDSDPLGLEYFIDFNPLFFVKFRYEFNEILYSSMPKNDDVTIPERNLSIDKIQDIDIDWYYFMARDILHMSEEEFLTSTPAKIFDLLKLYNKLSNKESSKISKAKGEVTMKALPNTI